ncbi:MAG: hypothetical protein ABIH38_02475 [Patescibacteria group bacterium]
MLRIFVILAMIVSFGMIVFPPLYVFCVLCLSSIGVSFLGCLEDKMSNRNRGKMS